MHDRETTRDQDLSPKAAAWELDYYTVETEAGPSDAIERALSRGEALTATALRDIDAGNFPPSDASRGAIASFMAMQFARGKAFRAMGDEIAQAQIELLAAGLAAHPDYARRSLAAALGRDVGEDEVEGALKQLRTAKITAHATRELHIQAMAHVADASFRFFAYRKWFLFRTTDLSTSDEPVELWSRPRNSQQEPVGAANADEILMAIAPDRALCLALPDELTGRDTGPERVIDLDVATGDQIRRRLWRNAVRYTFRHPASPIPRDT